MDIQRSDDSGLISVGVPGAQFSREVSEDGTITLRPVDRVTDMPTLEFDGEIDPGIYVWPRVFGKSGAFILADLPPRELAFIAVHAARAGGVPVTVETSPVDGDTASIVAEIGRDVVLYQVPAIEVDGVPVEDLVLDPDPDHTDLEPEADEPAPEPPLEEEPPVEVEEPEVEEPEVVEPEGEEEPSLPGEPGLDKPEPEEEEPSLPDPEEDDPGVA